MRHWDFTLLVAVVLDTNDLGIVEAWELEVDTVRAKAAYVKSLNGYRLTLAQVRTLGRDVTRKFRAAEARLDV